MLLETAPRIAAGAALALVGVYAYAAAALWAHARLATLAPPRSLAHALLVGALMPACGCTALAYARRAPERLRAPFLVAAYAANPLLVLAAALIGGWRAAAAVLALALLAALAARALPAGERPRTRLDDLLLRRDGSPLRDAAPYVAAYAAPALGLGALVGLAAAAPALVGALAVGALALLFAPPHADVAQDHGGRVARGVRGLVVLFALCAAAAVALL
ncbi:MAG TPA: hypothetical protein VFH78_02190 [Candidatus Thermoplasmatota archaeon]|nr:hypothetical protein [Candidatus Thermoplasmatota archaeon]